MDQSFGSLEGNRLLQDSVCLAVEAINVKEEEQKLDIRCCTLIIYEVNARHITDYSLRLHPRGVDQLGICNRGFTAEVV